MAPPVSTAMHMHYIYRYTFLIAALWLQASLLVAQQDNVISLPVQLSITPKASLNLAGENMMLRFTPDKGAEQIITPSTVGKLWLNYSSIIEGSSTNSIYVSLTSTNLPAEIMVKLTIGPDVGVGSGQLGTPAKPIFLSLTPQPIVTNIGSCFTGQGMNKGHELTYSWELAPNYDPELLKIAELNIQAGVIYTIVTNE